MRRLAAALAAAAALGGAAESTAAARPFLIADSVASPRLLDFEFAGNALRWSPDGKRYLLVVARADLPRDGLWVDFLTGEAFDPQPPQSALTLFTRALGEMPATYDNSVSWLRDNETVAFLWPAAGGHRQAMTLNLRTHELRRLTRHATDVIQFAVSPNGETTLYSAFAPHSASRTLDMQRRGFAVPDVSGFAFLMGDLDAWNPWEHVELFIQHHTGVSLQRLTLPSTRSVPYTLPFEFSPDNRHVIVGLAVSDPPEHWNGYSSAWLNDVALPMARRKSPDNVLRQLHWVDTATREIRPVWDAPQTYREQFIWAPDGRSVRIGSTFLPLTIADSCGVKGEGMGEVTVEGGSAIALPPASPEAGCEWREPARRRDEIELYESLNDPPAVRGSNEPNDGSNLFELHPHLATRFTLGRVELLHWTQPPDGRQWTGRLYYPTHFTTKRRFALVIQTHADTRTAFSGFSLIGDDHYPSVFAAQALANRDIAVLQMGNPDDYAQRGVPMRDEARIFQSGMESGLARLADLGIVDLLRVGLTGFSRTGWHVEYALAHSKFRFAAAIADDHFDAGYFQAALGQWHEEYAKVNGGEAFGQGLQAWLEETPAFNAHRIRTPLRLQVNAGGAAAALGHWEMFSRLKHLHKPVELYVIPDVERGTHNLQNPRQLLASAGGAVDWFDFWLNGSADPDPANAEQYARWRALSYEP